MAVKFLSSKNATECYGSHEPLTQCAVYHYTVGCLQPHPIDELSHDKLVIFQNIEVFTQT